MLAGALDVTASVTYVTMVSLVLLFKHGGEQVFSGFVVPDLRNMQTGIWWSLEETAEITI